MRTQHRNGHYHNRWYAHIRLLAAAVFFVLLAGCNDTDPKDEEDTDYWKDAAYELDWDLPAGGSSLRFKGFFFECTMGKLKGACEISGTMPGDIVIDTRDTLISVTQDVPEKYQEVLTRTVDIQLKGTMSISGETTCNMTFDLHVEFDVNVKDKTGTFKYPATGITSSMLTCEGLSVPWPVPFSSLLSGDTEIMQESLPPCLK
jgi:hypothetical protein